MDKGHSTLIQLKSRKIFSLALTLISPVLLFSLISISCGTGEKIIDSPISFSSKRIELTEEYIHQHYGITPKDISIVPKIIVLHWTAIGTYDSTLQYSIKKRSKALGRNLLPLVN